MPRALTRESQPRTFRNRPRPSEGVRDETDTVLKREARVLLCSLLSKLGKALRRVSDTVDTDGAGVELVSGILGVGKRDLDFTLVLEEDLTVDRDLAVSSDGLEHEGNVPERLVLLGAGVTSGEETVLLDLKAISLLGNSENGETLLQDPVLHDGSNVAARRLADTVPEILGDGVGVEVLLEVDGNTLEEDILTDHVGKHAKHTGTLEYEIASKTWLMASSTFSPWRGPRWGDWIACRQGRERGQGGR